jgi:LmbE family N-acetylglucosaminyl deacetylase
LCVAAHPDDGIHPDEAGALREEEERLGAAEVGVETVQFLDYQDGVAEYGLPLRRDIARAIRQYRPGCGDQRAVHRPDVRRRSQSGGPSRGRSGHFGRRSRAGNRWIFPELLDEGLKPWPGVRYICFAGAQQPTHGVDVTGYLDRGIALLQAHATYLKGLGAAAFDPAEFLT